MAITATYEFTLPTVGGDTNVWGASLNANWTALDALLDGTDPIAPNLVGWSVGGTLVTATAAELNLLDGVTASTAELNILDGVTASTAELNILDGVTATASELNALDGITATVTELNYTDGVTSNIQTQLNTKAALASPILEGTPTAPTAATSTDTTQIATTAFVQDALGSAGATVLLDRIDMASGALSNVTFTFDETLYDKVFLVINNVHVTLDDRGFRFQTSSDGGSSFDNGSTDYRTPSGTGPLVDFAPLVGNAANEDGVSATVTIYAPGLSSQRTRITVQGVYVTSAGVFTQIDVVSERQDAAILNGIQFSTALGQLSVGNITMYGVKK